MDFLNEQTGFIFATRWIATVALMKSWADGFNELLIKGEIPFVKVALIIDVPRRSKPQLHHLDAPAALCSQI